MARSSAFGCRRFRLLPQVLEGERPVARIPRASSVRPPRPARRPRWRRIDSMPRVQHGLDEADARPRSPWRRQRCRVPRSSVARTALPRSRSPRGPSARSRGARLQSPTKGGRGHCACMATSRSMARSGGVLSRARSIWRASVARLIWRRLRVGGGAINWGLAACLARSAQPVRHADELGEGAGLHLLHDAGAVDLDRLLGRAQLGAHLLVEQAGDDEAEDLALTGGERVVAGLEQRTVGPLGPPLRGPGRGRGEPRPAGSRPRTASPGSPRRRPSSPGCRSPRSLAR